MPHNLLGRIALRILAFEWWAWQALVFTAIGAALAFVGLWGWAVVTGIAALIVWGITVYDEVRIRRTEDA